MTDRLDYNKPPRLYLEHSSDPQEEEALFVDPRYEACYLGMTRGESLLAAWAHYKAHNDPPGMRVEEVTGADVAWRWVVTASRECRALAGSQHGARAAAWAWYDRRLAVHAKVADDPRHRIDFCGSCGAENEPQDDDECPQCGSTSCLISTWGEQQAERYRTSERYTENDPSIDDDSPTWPRCLTWPDAQVAEVERWLADSTAEKPKVLRG